MSTEQDQARLIAERIARRVSQQGVESVGAGGAAQDVSAHDVGGELAAVRASLDELQKRLAHIESHLTHDEDEHGLVEEGSLKGREPVRSENSQASAPEMRSPWLSGIYVPATHPSQEKFGVTEATVAELVDFFEGEKRCELEPGGKPCDHCAMCSSRGF